MKLLTTQPPVSFDKQRIHVMVNSIECTSYKISLTMEEYHRNLRQKFNVFKAKILQQIKTMEITQPLSCNSTVMRTKDQLQISAKLNSLQKYLDPLEKLITKCETQLQSEILSPEKISYYRASATKLKNLRSILLGNDFCVPKDSTCLEYLTKIEVLMISMVQRLSSHVSCETAIEEEKPKQDNDNTDFTFDGFLLKTSLQEFKEIFIQNEILLESDFRNLSENQMKELHLPIGARNRIHKYFGRGNSFEDTFNKQENFEKMKEHFMCPITQDIMKDPVLSSDGYTYERDAIEKWFAQSNKSPLTGLVLSDTSLRPNHNLRCQIDTFGSFLA